VTAKGTGPGPGLRATRRHCGGVRWRGRCPLVVNGVGCGRRVAKLNRPPGARYFGCRHCRQLTYRGAQEHDKRVRALRKNPAAFPALMANLEAATPNWLFPAITALRPRRQP
jgi:hypothetical protein